MLKHTTLIIDNIDYIIYALIRPAWAHTIIVISGTEIAHTLAWEQLYVEI